MLNCVDEVKLEMKMMMDGGDVGCEFDDVMHDGGRCAQLCGCSQAEDEMRMNGDGRFLGVSWMMMARRRQLCSTAWR